MCHRDVFPMLLRFVALWCSSIDGCFPSTLRPIWALHYSSGEMFLVLDMCWGPSQLVEQSKVSSLASPNIFRMCSFLPQGPPMAFLQESKSKSEKSFKSDTALCSKIIQNHPDISSVSLKTVFKHCPLSKNVSPESLEVLMWHEVWGIWMPTLNVALPAFPKCSWANNGKGEVSNGKK